MANIMEAILRLSNCRVMIVARNRFIAEVS